MFTVEQIKAAHSKVKSGADFPGYIRQLKSLGVRSYETWVKDSHTDYFGASSYRISSMPMYDNLSIDITCNKVKFENYLRLHQQGGTDYFTFCRHCAETGIEKWIVSIDEMTCIYYNKSTSAVLIEKIPS